MGLCLDKYFFKILLENIALKWRANAYCKSSNILSNVLPASLEITHVTSDVPRTTAESSTGSLATPPSRVLSIY